MPATVRRARLMWMVRGGSVVSEVLWAEIDVGGDYRKIEFALVERILSKRKKCGMSPARFLSVNAPRLISARCLPYLCDSRCINKTNATRIGYYQSSETCQWRRINATNFYHDHDYALWVVTGWRYKWNRDGLNQNHRGYN